MVRISGIAPDSRDHTKRSGRHAPLLADTGKFGKQVNDRHDGIKGPMIRYGAQT